MDARLAIGLDARVVEQAFAESVGNLLLVGIDNLGIIHFIGERTIINQRVRGLVEHKTVRAREVDNRGGAHLLRVFLSFALGPLFNRFVMTCRE